MNFPDGEYEIDLLALLGNAPGAIPAAGLLAIRYGFIPDSMDQSKPLMLYQKDNVCVLEAQLLNNRPKNVPASIIFEGIPQRPRTMLAPGSDSYYLSLVAGETPRVALRPLKSTMRVSKTRNVKEWQKKIAEWSAMAEDLALARSQAQGQGSAERNNQLTVEDLSRSQGPSHSYSENRSQSQIQSGSRSHAEAVGKETQNARRLNPKSAKIPEKPDLGKISDVEKPVVAKRNTASKTTARATKTTSATEACESTTKKPAALPLTPTRRTVASKRSPAPLIESDIISVSDFEDLDSDIDENTVTCAETKSDGDSSKQDAETSSVDEFQDLENQLEEVLENSEPPQKPPNPRAGCTISDSSDSDEDMDTGAFSGGPIVIDMGHSPPDRRGTQVQAAVTSSQPMSLNELYEDGENDDFSCSEEE